MAINILTYGAVGDGKTLCTESFRKAVEAAEKSHESIIVPAGIYLTGTINLKSASLHLEKGAVIKGSPNMEDYPVQDFVHNELGGLRALIVCFDQQNIVIDGEGTIDLNGSSFYDFNSPLVPESKVPFTEAQKRECTVKYAIRPNQCIFFHNVKGLTVKGITVLDAPCWTFSFNECENVKVHGLTINTSLNIPNDDGIHFCSCNGIIVSDCHITSGDDCIAVSGITNWAKTCENIIITNCVLRSCSKAIVLGYIYSHVRNVLIDNVIIQGSNRGLCFMSDTDCGLVENVRVTNMIIDTRIRAGNWWGNGEAIFAMAVKHDEHIPAEQKPDRETNVNFKNIVIDGVYCMSENAIGIIGTGKNVQSFFLKNITIERRDSENLPLKGNTFDIAPSHTIVEVPQDCGVYIKNAEDVVLDHVTVMPFHGKELSIIVE